MVFHILTIFPEFFRGPFDHGVVGRAVDSGAIEIRVHDLRKWTFDRHRTVDDRPYGGGPGMVLKAEPFQAAIAAARERVPAGSPVVFLTPQGRRFNQRVAREFAVLPGLVLVAGRYEGFDERLLEAEATDEISLGDFVLTGGELPALAVIDALTRLIPGALGDPEAAADDSHATGLLEYPHYTRPPQFRGWEVPEILRSGDHGKIAAWRRRQALKRTAERRPDLLEKMDLSDEDKKFLEENE